MHIEEDKRKGYKHLSAFSWRWSLLTDCLPTIAELRGVPAQRQASKQKGTSEDAFQMGWQRQPPARVVGLENKQKRPICSENDA
jgi:hypothetical protein